MLIDAAGRSPFRPNPYDPAAVLRGVLIAAGIFAAAVSLALAL